MWLLWKTLTWWSHSKALDRYIWIICHLSIRVRFLASQIWHTSQVESWRELWAVTHSQRLRLLLELQSSSRSAIHTTSSKHIPCTCWSRLLLEGYVYLLLSKHLVFSVHVGLRVNCLMAVLRLIFKLNLDFFDFLLKILLCQLKVFLLSLHVDLLSMDRLL